MNMTEMQAIQSIKDALDVLQIPCEVCRYIDGTAVSIPLGTKDNNRGSILIAGYPAHSYIVVSASMEHTLFVDKKEKEKA